ncbi:uncharacterized protein METZ01_LOCUS26297 [marine metagenome]|uniref:Uncharacterized protein n=1 Tax=marine metagenome TaxID=408172 RepID=A0A381Q756_9ZZZZ
MLQWVEFAGICETFNGENGCTVSFWGEH